MLPALGPVRTLFCIKDNEVTETKPDKYAPWTLELILFGEFGQKLKTVYIDKGTYAGTVDEGNRRVREGECASFVVRRVMHNSLRKHRWESD